MSGYVYFMRAGKGGPIKIGTAVNVEARRKSLTTGCPQELIVLTYFPGGSREEKELHKQFAAHRQKGEWFAAAPEILSYIEGCRNLAKRASVREYVARMPEELQSESLLLALEVRFSSFIEPMAMRA